MRKLALFLFCGFHTLFDAQVHKYTPKVRFAAETYAFLKGQSAALQKIALQFPALQPQIETAEKESKVLFGRAERNIAFFLKDELNNSQFTILKNHIDSLVYEQLKNPIEKEKYALDYLNLVKERQKLIKRYFTITGNIIF